MPTRHQNERGRVDRRSRELVRNAKRPEFQKSHERLFAVDRNLTPYGGDRGAIEVKGIGFQGDSAGRNIGEPYIEENACLRRSSNQ